MIDMTWNLDALILMYVRKADLQIPLSPIHISILCAAPLRQNIRFAMPATAFHPSLSPSVSLSAASIPPPPPPVSDVTIILKKRRRGVGRPTDRPTSRQNQRENERAGEEEWSGSCRRRRSEMFQGALVIDFECHFPNEMIR